MEEVVFHRRSVLGVIAALCATRTRANEAKGGANVYQLRIYEIFEQNKAAFHDRFRDHAARIMARYGFEIRVMWEARGETGPEFVYLLHWQSEDAMATHWASFMADEEWARIKDDTAARHGQLVGRIQSRVLYLTPYSPSLG